MNAAPPIADDAVVRCFIAIDIDEATRAALADAVAGLAEWRRAVRWVPPANRHLTLFFLGDVFGARLAELAGALDVVAAAAAPFDFAVRGLGAFGRPRAPRVLWAGVPDPPPALGRLQAAVADAVAALGFPREERPYRPHLTLGRVRPGARVGALTAALDARKSEAFGRVHVASVRLVRSERLAEGARHSLLHDARLKGR